ncbi:hypothetical protein GCM10027569_45640 [Flindersiella endophytica]
MVDKIGDNRLARCARLERVEPRRERDQARTELANSVEAATPRKWSIEEMRRY